MTKSNNSPSWLGVLKELIEAYFKSSRGASHSRTWNQHVVPYEDGWAVRREGNKQITSKHIKQSTAINKAKVLAKKYKANVIIHRQDGTIRDQVDFD
ncbi:DUF2188 domain-containing protein [Litoribaculum gwangyangense]|uniref:DUF2188 domain-containing protein n=1 Tax=Litoribaculum gwangyangense TaxID=1130722 RepID=A0ABP9C3J3_9FLAO